MTAYILTNILWRIQMSDIDKATVFNKLRWTKDPFPLGKAASRPNSTPPFPGIYFFADCTDKTTVLKPGRVLKVGKTINLHVRIDDYVYNRGYWRDKIAPCHMNNRDKIKAVRPEIVPETVSKTMYLWWTRLDPIGYERRLTDDLKPLTKSVHATYREKRGMSVTSRAPNIAAPILTWKMTTWQGRDRVPQEVSEGPGVYFFSNYTKETNPSYDRPIPRGAKLRNIGNGQAATAQIYYVGEANKLKERLQVYKTPTEWDDTYVHGNGVVRHRMRKSRINSGENAEGTGMIIAAGWGQELIRTLKANGEEVSLWWAHIPELSYEFSLRQELNPVFEPQKTKRPG
jgi:hypothetical protein